MLIQAIETLRWSSKEPTYLCEVKNYPRSCFLITTTNIYQKKTQLGGFQTALKICSFHESMWTHEYLQQRKNRMFYPEYFILERDF